MGTYAPQITNRLQANKIRTKYSLKFIVSENVTVLICLGYNLTAIRDAGRYIVATCVNVLIIFESLCPWSAKPSSLLFSTCA